MVPVRVSRMRAAREARKIAMRKTRRRRVNCFEGRRERTNWVKAMSWRRPKMPRAAMCSEVRTGMKPTKGICIEARVPRA